MNVSLDPQRVVTSVLTPVLGAEILNPVGRTIIQGMDYETGKWSPEVISRTGRIPFAKQHKDPPFMFLVYSNDDIMIARAHYGKFFINYLSLFGSALKQPSPYNSMYGAYSNWYTGSSAVMISKANFDITTEAALAGHASNESITIGFFDSSNTYVRSEKIYNWIAVFMPE